MKKNLSEKISNIALENTRDGIMVTDEKNRITYVNKAFSKVTGYTSDEVMGRNPTFLKSDYHDKEFYLQMWESIDKEGFWQGEIWDKRKNGEEYLQYLSIQCIKDENEGSIHYIGVFTDTNKLYESEKRLERITYYDNLTSLPNREQLIQYLEKQIENSKRHHKLLAVLMLDLDDFKTINDRHGHAIGDRLLMIISQRLKKLIRSSDMVGRLGGDEFSLILHDLNNIDELEHMTERLQALVATPIDIDGKKFTTSVSTGITLYPFDGGDADTLLRHADQAMFTAKENGKNRYHLFDTEKDQLTQTRRELLNRLELALHQEELVLHYQPKVNLRSGQVIGVEALIRWQHPDDGLLPPGHFLPHIEHHDLIIEIGKWVMRSALVQLTKWSKQGMNLSISINIAARQLLQRDFVMQFSNILADYPDAPAHLFEVEILESAALENTEHVRKVIDECRALGVKFSLDDFGTGYASLSYLRDIPADYLKIDRVDRTRRHLPVRGIPHQSMLTRRQR